MTKLTPRKLTPFPQSIGRLRQRPWITLGVTGFTLLGMMTAFALVPSPDANRQQLHTVLEQLSVSTTGLVSSDDALFLREEIVLQSDSVSSLLIRLGISDQKALDFVYNNREAQTISRQLRPGKAVSAKTGMNGELIALYFPLNSKDSMLFIEKRGSSFVATEQALSLETQTVVKSGEIRSSLFGATDEAGIPDAIATQLAEIFSADIDFYRDLRKGDRFSLVYETYNQHGQAIRSGRILSAEFINDHKPYGAYWYQTAEGESGYYTAEGKSLRKAFLRSPLEFSRVTSGFSSARVHPVLMVSRAHKGVDYGAPTGTPVRAVADGIVEFSGRQGGYGNLIILKHQAAYSTAYGHLNGFANGIRKGSGVHQGDTIAYVGQTGLATGPHLHYEFRVNSHQVNPLSMALPAALPLNPSQINQFKTTIAPLQDSLGLARQIVFARNDSGQE